MSRLTDPVGMNGKLHIDAQALMREIAHYLAVVDAFRAELCEPTWLAELAPDARRAGTSRRPAPSRARRG